MMIQFHFSCSVLPAVSPSNFKENSDVSAALAPGSWLLHIQGSVMLLGHLPMSARLGQALHIAMWHLNGQANPVFLWQLAIS